MVWHPGMPRVLLETWKREGGLDRVTEKILILGGCWEDERMLGRG